ncbi:MAG: hypothetical protein ACUVWO_05745 [Thermodesulfobacteriota bacterium]
MWTVLGCAAYFLATLLHALRFRWLIDSRQILNRIGGVAITEGLASLMAARVYDFSPSC